MRGFISICMIVGAMIVPQSAAADAVKAPCAVLFGGGGDVLADPKINSVWLQADAIVNRSASAYFAQHDFAVQAYFSDLQGSDKRLAFLIGVLNTSGCTETIQIARVLGVAPQDATFTYKVSVFHLDKSAAVGGARYVVVGDYSKDYRYARTVEVLRTLSLPSLGQQIAADIEASSVLAGMKTAHAGTGAP